MFSVVDSADPIRGKYVVASRDISPGEKILVESPLMFADGNSLGICNYTLGLKLMSSSEIVNQTLKLYPGDSKDHEFFGVKKKIVDEGLKLFNWKLENQPDTSHATSSQFKSILAIIFLNTFNVYDEFGNVTRTCLYDSTSRFNHSCWPNACWEIEKETNNMVIRSMENIKNGDEITISYTELYNPTNIRRKKLLESHFFLCNCRRCTDSSFRPKDAGLDLISKTNEASNELFDAMESMLSRPIDLDSRIFCNQLANSMQEMVRRTEIILSPHHHLVFHMKHKLSRLLFALKKYNESYYFFNKVSESMAAIYPAFWPEKAHLFNRMIDCVNEMLKDKKAKKTELETSLKQLKMKYSILAKVCFSE